MASNNTNKKESNKKPTNTRGKFNNRKKFPNKNRNSGKEMEVDIPDSSVNSADLPHVVTSAKKDNDPSWYTHIYPLIGDYASLPFSIPVGSSYDPRSGLSGKGGQGAQSVTLSIGTRYRASGITPGIFTISIMPSIGVSTSPDSAPNIAAQQIYTLDRAANSGAKNYDKTDVMMLITGLDSAYMLYEELLRAYRIFGMYNYMNRYMPDALLYSLGFSPSLVQEYSALRGVIDQYAYKLGAINIPDQFDFIHRHSWLFTNVYKDSESDKAQLYAYKPDYYYTWTEGTDDKPTFLKLTTRKQLYGLDSTNVDGIVSSISQIEHAINKIMTPLLGSQDVGIISGDLVKAFGEGGMIKILPVQDHEVLTPVYSPEVIEQMSNGSIHRLTPLGDGCDIRPQLDNLVAGPYLVHQPTFVKSNSVLASICRKHLINYRMLSPSPENNMVVTRLVNTFENDDIAGGTNAISSCGTEIVTDAKMWYFPYNSQTGQIADQPIAEGFEQDRVFTFSDPESTTARVSGPQFTQILEQMIVSSKFDNCPTQYFYSYDTPALTPGENNLRYWGHSQDDNDYTMLDRATIEQLNNVALLSEFAVKDYKTGVK